MKFIISGSVGLDYNLLSFMLEQLGFVEISVEDGMSVPKLDFIWVQVIKEYGMKFDERIYGIRCVLKNVLDCRSCEVVANKGRLHMTVMKHEKMARQLPRSSSKWILSKISRNVAWTIFLKDLNYIKPGDIFILRPTTGWAGKGIERVESQEQLEKVKARMLKADPYTIASRYIKDPFLWYSKDNPSLKYKMHFRMYWMVIAGKKFEQFLWERGEIFIASKPYEPCNYHDHAIHDTHGKSTPMNLFFPRDLEHILSPDQIEQVFGEMKFVMETIGSYFESHAKPFAESDYAYEVFGIDFMLDSKRNLFLIEINQKAGYEPSEYDSSFEEFTKAYFEWNIEKAISKIFPS